MSGGGELTMNIQKSNRVPLRWSVPVVLALALLSGCGGTEPTTPEAAESSVPVETMTAAAEEMAVIGRTPGSVQPWVRVSPGTKILGRIAEVSFREGDRVKQGDILAHLEDTDLRAAVDQAEATLAMARAQFENAAAQYRRMTDLHQRGSVTAKNLEDATAGYRVAAAAQEQAEANLAAARVTMSYADVKSPVTGWLVKKMVEAGDMASPGMPMFTVEDLTPARIVLQVPESDVVGISNGDPVRIEVEALARYWDATVDRIVPAADSSGRSYEVHVMVGNEDGALRSGMFARGEFRKGMRKAILVPAEALVRRGQLEGLFVVGDDQVARIRWVRTGRIVGGGVEILSGMEAGERFVAAPAPGFADGTPVTTEAGR